MTDSASPEIEIGCVEGKNKDIPSKLKNLWNTWCESCFSRCERELDEETNKARSYCLWNTLFAIIALLLILCLTKSVFELITSLDKSWIRYIYGIEVFLCAAVIIHLFCERQRIKTEFLAKTQDTENAHYDAEEIMPVIKQTPVYKHNYNAWMAFLVTIIVSCLWIETAILFYKADKKEEITAARMQLFLNLPITFVYVNEMMPMIINSYVDSLDISSI
ncbi:hypothetical protein CRE_18664 [Caenorhabditis remanei]|uniref:Uncharacterized protein n=1 Tax=Caenorhabditis remanei TaxID=31234 RepID=E3LKW0_CAERE|nr:hypothetical protein CRE_18664 [Caenorhabditis remanei]